MPTTLLNIYSRSSPCYILLLHRLTSQFYDTLIISNMSTQLQTCRQIAPYTGRSILDVFSVEIFHEVFNELLTLRTVDRLSFALTCRQARGVVMEWSREAYSYHKGGPIDGLTKIMLDPALERPFFYRSELRKEIRWRYFKTHPIDQYQDFSFRLGQRIIFHNWNTSKDYQEGKNSDKIECCQLYQRVIYSIMNQSPPSHLRGSRDIIFEKDPTRSNRSSLKQPSPLYTSSDGTSPPIVPQLSMLATTFLMDPWLFLYPEAQRTCIGCSAALKQPRTSLTCEDRHDLDIKDVLREFFICSDYPGCYSLDDLVCQQTYVRKLQEGYLPEIGLQCCRLYWHCQEHVRQARNSLQEMDAVEGPNKDC